MVGLPYGNDLPWGGRLSEQEESRGEGHIWTVGMERPIHPSKLTDEKGSPKGVSVDLANELGKALGKKIVSRTRHLTGSFQPSKTGKIDIIISSMTITDERKQSIDFSDPYLTTGLCLLVGKKVVRQIY